MGEENRVSSRRAKSPRKLSVRPWKASLSPGTAINIKVNGTSYFLQLSTGFFLTIPMFFTYIKGLVNRRILWEKLSVRPWKASLSPGTLLIQGKRNFLLARNEANRSSLRNNKDKTGGKITFQPEVVIPE